MTAPPTSQDRALSLKQSSRAAVLLVALLGASMTIAVPVSAGRTRGAALRGAHVAACVLPGTRRTIDQLWHPDVPAAIRYARTRRGDIAFAVRTAGRLYGYRPEHREWSASVVKAMLLVTYLDLPTVRERPLTAREQALLGPMIRVSDNDDAQAVFDTVGQSGLTNLARRVGMRDFAPNPVWGATLITAADQTLLFLHIDRYVAPRHRSYAMRLLRSVSPQDRWGIGELAPRGWRLYFKGGWGYATGLLDHQVALLARGCSRVAIAVLTMYDGSHAYGKASLRGLFARLLTGLPKPGRKPKPGERRRREPRRRYAREHKMLQESLHLAPRRPAQSVSA